MVILKHEQQEETQWLYV